jgi:hypothetical protein
MINGAKGVGDGGGAPNTLWVRGGSGATGSSTGGAGGPIISLPAPEAEVRAFAPGGHAALHPNVRPSFGVLDALQNLHRME